MIKLTANWRAVLAHAWSVRLMLFAAFFSGVEVALPFLHGLLPISNGLFAVLSFAAVVLAFISRFVAQPQSLPAAPSETKPNYKTGE